MFLEELNAIRQTEEQAEQIKKDAKLEVKSLIDRANTEAGRVISEAEATAKERYEVLIKEGEETARKEYEEALAEARDKAETMVKSASERRDRVVQYIAERIVEISVNS